MGSASVDSVLKRGLASLWSRAALLLVCVGLAGAESAANDLTAIYESAIYPSESDVQVSLRYDAYIAGIHSGEAQLTLAKSALVEEASVPGPPGHRYQVSGVARSLGLWESIQQWRAEYSVDGVMRGNRSLKQVDPGHFYSLQTTPRKRREIHIEDGVLKETKNHKVRDPRPAQTGFDLLTALFFLPACHPEVRVHTGRDGYEMRRIGSAPQVLEKQPTRCRYEVTDEDGSRYQMSLEYAERMADSGVHRERSEPFLVPSEIRVKGPVAGRLVLTPR